MMRSMYSGVSGLRNHQIKMDVIGNNIANINTAGYKKSRVVFQDTLYQMMKSASGAAEGGSRGGTNPMGIGLGVTLASIDQIHSAAPTTDTNRMTDLAINGDGYFVLGTGNELFYTRAGAFEFDGNNTLVSIADGYNVLGWMADNKNFQLNTSLAPSAININGYKTLASKATSEMTLAGNLNAATDFYAGLDEQQDLKFSIVPNGKTEGYFRLRFDGQNSAWIKVEDKSSDTAKNIQAALEKLDNIGTGNVQVSWNNAQQKYNIVFTGELARTDVAKLIFLPGPAITFDGGEATVQGGSQHTSLKFKDSPEGGTQNSYFQLAVGDKNTALIQVGATTTDTEINIENALAAIGNSATVTWDDANQRYNIDFDIDPEGVITFRPVSVQLTDGAGGSGDATTGGSVGKNCILQFTGSPDPGGNFILEVNGAYTKLIAIGSSEEETAHNIQDAINELLKAPAGSNLVNVAWDGPTNNRFLIDFTSAPTSFNFELANNADAVFTGGKATYGTQNPAIQFAVDEAGGTEGGAFVLTMGSGKSSLSTGPIFVGADTATTAKNIEDALNELDLPNGANASVSWVSWDDTNKRFQINFDIDPHQALTVTEAIPFTGGNGAISVVQEGQTPMIITPRDEVQSLSFAENAKGGTPGVCFKLRYDGQTTDFISVGAEPAKTAENIQAALENLSNIGVGNLAVAWNENNKSYDITFQGDLRRKDVKAITCVPAPLFDGGASALSQTGKVSLRFEKPEGGSLGGQFILSLGGKNTALIEVGNGVTDPVTGALIGTETDTAIAIKTALDNLTSMNNTVSWNATDKRYDIVFERDPGAELALHPVAKAFDGGTGQIGRFDTQHTRLKFADIPEGGAEGSQFTLTIGANTTAAITVGPDSATTAGNIQNALNNILNPLTPSNGAVVTWDPIAKHYKIDFTADPGGALSFASIPAGGGTPPVPPAFTGGAAAAMGNIPDELCFELDPSGGSEGGNFILTIGGRNTGLIEVAANSQATAKRIEDALNDVLRSLPQGATATVTWNNTFKNYQISFNVDPNPNADPSFSFDVTISSAEFDGGQETISGTQDATVAFAEKETGGSEGGTFQLWFGKNYDSEETIKTAAIRVGKDTAETASNIQTALNALVLPNGAQSTVSWDSNKKQYDIDFSKDPGQVLNFKQLNFDGGTASIVTNAQGSAVLDYPEENHSIVTSKEVYDSQGGKHTVYFRFFKYEIQPGDAPGAGDLQPVTRWACDLSLDPQFEAMTNYNLEEDFQSVDITGVSPTVGTGTKLFRIYNMEFDENGAIKEPASSQVIFPINSQSPKPGNGTENLEINMDFKDLTQYNALSNARVEFLDGNTSGELLSYNIDTNGNINGIYDNGEIRTLAQLAMRNFRNPSGLLQVGGTMFQESANSGALDIGTAGTPGLGTIMSRQLEMSNVDLSEEFTDMIIAQRGFQANSRIITTSDEMIQELVNLKR